MKRTTLSVSLLSALLLPALSAPALAQSTTVVTPAPGTQTVIQTTTTPTGTSTVQTSTVQTQSIQVQPAAPVQGQASVAIGTMRCKSQNCYSGLGEGISDALTTALLNTGKFAVYERENIATLNEEDFLNGGANFEGVDLLIMGSITQYEPNASSGGLSFLGISLGKKSSSIAMDLRIVDAKSRRIIGAVQVAGKAEGNNFNLSNWRLPVSLGQQSSPQVEAAIAQMLTDAAQQLAQRVPAQYFRR